MNSRLIFLGFLSVIMAFYLKVQADKFGFPDGHLSELEGAQQALNYVFSILVGILGLCLFYLSWKPPVSVRPAIVLKAATALYLFMLLIFVAINYFLGLILSHGTGG